MPPKRTSPRKNKYVPPYRRTPANTDDSSPQGTTTHTGTPYERSVEAPTPMPYPFPTLHGFGDTRRLQSAPGLPVPSPAIADTSRRHSLAGSIASSRGSQQSVSDDARERRGSTESFKYMQSQEAKSWRVKPNVPESMQDSSYNGSIDYLHCKRTTRNINHFTKGQIIVTTHHVSNANPKVDVDDHHLNLHCGKGGVYSKTRFFIILWKHIEHLFVLPLFTFGERGVKARPKHIRHEYICIKNQGDTAFVNLNKQHNEPLEAIVEDGQVPMKDSSCCRMTGGLTIHCKDDLDFIGRLTEESYKYLLQKYDELINVARIQPVEL